MGKFVFAMNVSVDGYVDDASSGLVMGRPSSRHFDYWIDTLRNHAGAVYGRRMYDLMRYWDNDRPEWNVSEREFAAVWRKLPKWVASRTLDRVGPNATLISRDLEATLHQLIRDIDGPISVSGPELAASVSKLGLIDEYHLHIRPFVLGGGKPFLQEAIPPLRLISSTLIDADTVHLVYAPRR